MEVIDPVEFKEIQINCTNDQWDAVKYTCSGKLIDQKGKEITDQSFSIDWKVANVNPAISKTSKSSEKVELILDWPTNRKANETPSRDFTANVVVKQNGSEVGSKTQKLTVKRAITYTASIDGFDVTGANRTTNIKFTNIQGPEVSDTITYNWQYNFKNRYGNADSNTFGNQRDITNHDFKHVQDKIYYIGAINGDPFAGGNGIGLEIKGLSKPLTIYGVANQNAIFGPNYTFNKSSVVRQMKPYESQTQGVTGKTGWYMFAFIHGFQMAKQFESGPFSNLIKAEIRNETGKLERLKTGNNNIVSSFTVNKDGMSLSSQYLGFQFYRVREPINAYLDIYAYHTSSDALKGGGDYIKMGDQIYQYGTSSSTIWFDQVEWQFK